MGSTRDPPLQRGWTVQQRRSGVVLFVLRWVYLPSGVHGHQPGRWRLPTYVLAARVLRPRPHYASIDALLVLLVLVQRLLVPLLMLLLRILCLCVCVNGP
jgi:hypothetical protein